MTTERRIDLSVLEDPTIKQIYEGLLAFGVDDLSAITLAVDLAPHARNFNQARFTDIVWAVANWGNLTNKTLELTRLTPLEAIQFLVQPQGFTYAEQQAAPFRQNPRERRIAEQAFLQDEIRRLGIETPTSRAQASREAGLALQVQAAPVEAEARRRQRRVREEAVAVQGRRQEFFGDISPATGLIGEFIEGVPVPAARRFLRSELPSIFNQQGFARQEQQFAEEQFRLREQLRGIGGGVAFGTPEERGEIEREEREEQREIREGLRTAQRPFAKLLAGLDGLKRFQAQTPRERGFQSRVARPRTRFL